MFGALEFSDKMAGYGIQPIIGCELAVDFGDQDPSARNALAAAPARIVLLAARERGYRSLMRLNSRAFLETPIHQSPHIKFEWLDGDAEDLIALTGGPDGPISLAFAADQAALAATRCDRLAELFGDRLYIELQRHGIEKERRVEAALIDLAYAKGFPARRDQRALFRDVGRLRSPRRAALHRRRTTDRRDRSRSAHARSPLQDPRRDGGAVRRYSGGAGLHRRDCRALRVPPGHAQADPAALHGWRGHQRR